MDIDDVSIDGCLAPNIALDVGDPICYKCLVVKDNLAFLELSLSVV